MEKKTADKILIAHTKEHFALNSTLYAAHKDIVNAMEEYAAIKVQEERERIVTILNEEYDRYQFQSDLRPSMIRDIIQKIQESNT